MNILMNTTSTSKAGAVVLAILGLAASLTAAGPVNVNGPATPQPVTVTNPVTVANPVTTVGVSSGALTVNNGPANPVPTVNNPARGAWQHYFQCTLPFNATSLPCGNNYTVPVGKRLVIEEVSAYAQLTAGERDIFTLTTSVGPDTTLSHLIPARHYDGAVTFAVGGRTAKIYADGGTTVQILIDRHAGPGGLSIGAAGITLVGRLADQQ